MCPSPLLVCKKEVGLGSGCPSVTCSHVPLERFDQDVSVLSKGPGQQPSSFVSYPCPPFLSTLDLMS